MKDIKTLLDNELRRLKNGPYSDEKLGGLGSVRLVANCSFRPSDVLEKAKEVLEITNRGTLLGLLDNPDWRSQLPEWFVSGCIPPRTQREEEDRLVWWRTLSHEEQLKVAREEEWSLDDWLYWFQPENRYWYWWDAAVLEEEKLILVAVEAHDWPFPWDALRWLFRVAGATSLEAEK